MSVDARSTSRSAAAARMSLSTTAISACSVKKAPPPSDERKYLRMARLPSSEARSSFRAVGKAIDQIEQIRVSLLKVVRVLDRVVQVASQLCHRRWNPACHCRFSFQFS
jgi:hypothetical protein